MKKIGVLFMLALMTSTVQMWALTRGPWMDLKPAPCGHPCACEQAEMECQHGVPYCLANKDGGCDCVCVA